MTDSVRISLIIPVLNEAAIVESALQALQPWREAGHEVILVDGGSQDGTVERASAWVDQVLHSPLGRAAQMNLGAACASGELLLFHHIDSRLPCEAQTVLESMDKKPGWGRFNVRLSGSHWLLRWVEQLMNWRSRLTGIATGDQSLFIHRTLFEQVGGFPQQPLMEDIEISKRLKAIMPPRCCRQRVVTSSRRWEENGILNTIVLMWRLRWRYYRGTPAEVLVKDYYGS